MPHLSGISRILTSPLKLGLHFQSFKQHLLQVPLQGIWSCYIFSGRYFWNLGASLHDSLFLHLYMTEKIITYGWCQTQLSRNIALLDHSCINLSALLWLQLWKCFHGQFLLECFTLWRPHWMKPYLQSTMSIFPVQSLRFLLNQLSSLRTAAIFINPVLRLNWVQVPFLRTQHSSHIFLLHFLLSCSL